MEKKKVYHVELDVVDEVEKFIEETGDKSKDIEVLPEDIMLVHIKRAISRFGEIGMTKGLYMANVRITVPLYSEE